MPLIRIPYGADYLTHEIPKSRFRGEYISALHGYDPGKTQEALVDGALKAPIESPTLHELARGKRSVVIIASDHTRPVPSRILMPRLLREVRMGNPDAEITILIATGCHRSATRDELMGKFGAEIMEREKIVMHDCDDSEMTYLGRLPSAGELRMNSIAANADLLIAEGFIEPHFFAGFSGGRKSAMPGVCARETVLYNHNASFIADERARTGILDGNPIHADMLFAAKKVNLAFILNVVIDSEKRVVHAVAGDADAAHRAGCDFLKERCQISAPPADIVVTGNGGYPLDQNIYQAVKGMTAAEAVVRPGGVIIMCAQSGDGHGGDEFYKTFAEEKDLSRMLQGFISTPKEQTRVDQWQSQIFARVLGHARVIFVSDAPDDIVRDMRMTPAHSIGEALAIAEGLLGDPDASVACIPDGVSVIVS